MNKNNFRISAYILDTFTGLQNLNLHYTDLKHPNKIRSKI